MARAVLLLVVRGGDGREESLRFKFVFGS